MDAQEVDLFEQLKDEFKTGKVSKVTAVRCRDVWNIYNPTRKITYCMCSSFQRRIYGKDFIEWYESYNR
jgi:hypothetical protein